MALVTGLTKKLDIPGEDGQWITIRQLSWRQRERASEARTDQVMGRLKSMGPDILRELQGAQARPDVQAATADPLTAYDKALVLQFGITAWSYGDKVKPDDIDELDEATADWAAREIIAFSSPPTEEQQKNA